MELKEADSRERERIAEQEDFPGGLCRPPREKLAELQFRVDFINAVIKNRGGG